MYEIGDLVRVRTLDAIPPDDNYIQDSPSSRSYFGMSEDQLSELHDAGFLRIKYVEEAINAYGGEFRDTTPVEYALEIPEELGYWFDPVFLENMLEPEAESSSGEDLPDPDPASIWEFLAWEVSV